MHLKNIFLQRLGTISACFLLSIISFNQLFAQGSWIPVTNLSPNKNYGVMLLLTDGRVLAKTDWDMAHSFSCNCNGDPGDTWDMLTPDIHGSYVNGTWTTIAPMADTRVYFASQVLRDGRVYVAGGEYGNGGSKAEIYDPVTGLWTAAHVVPGDTIFDGSSQLLPDGRVLQALSYRYADRTCIYDPITNNFSPGPSVIGMHSESAWLLLKDNSILFADRSYGTVNPSAERYIPALNNWNVDAIPPQTLYDWGAGETGSAQLLPDGRGVFFGGSGNTLYYTPSGSPSPGSWSIAPHMPSGLGAPDGPTATMVNGKILCSLSDTNTATSWFRSPTYFYEFDYLAGTWTKISAPVGGDTLSGPCADNTMLTLPDGNVLFANRGFEQYYIYKPSGTPLAAGKPTVDNIIKITCTKYMAVGKLFNGISQGANYNDEWQNPTNYPLVRLTKGTNVYYARTYNWNSTGVMRGTAADTTYFDLPSGLPVGTYQLEVVVNGNLSVSRLFFTCGAAEVPTVSNVNSGIGIAPNPTKSSTSLVFHANYAGQYTVILTDITGRKLLQETGFSVEGENTFILHTDGIPSGVYMVSVSMFDGVVNGKILVD